MLARGLDGVQRQVDHRDEPQKGIDEPQLPLGACDCDAITMSIGTIIGGESRDRLERGQATRQFALLRAVVARNRCRSIHVAATVPKHGSAPNPPRERSPT